MQSTAIQTPEDVTPSKAGQLGAFGLAPSSASVFYADEYVTLYNADVRQVLPHLTIADAVRTGTRQLTKTA